MAEKTPTPTLKETMLPQRRNPIAANRMLSRDQAEFLAHSPDARHQVAAAIQRAVTEKTLLMLAKSPVPAVTRAVASNVITPPPILALLSDSTDIPTLFAVVKNKATPHESLEKLKSHPDPLISSGAARAEKDIAHRKNSLRRTSLRRTLEEDKQFDCFATLVEEALRSRKRHVDNKVDNKVDATSSFRP